MNAITDKKVTDTLIQLHEKAQADHVHRQAQKEKAVQMNQQFDRSWSTAYMAVGPEEGRLLYFLATICVAKTIVEFGCSFGISTIYLAAAAKDNQGIVISSDLEVAKVDGARKNLDQAGLGHLVEIRQGDAMETLSSVKGPIDFLFLDGAKDLYLPLFEMLCSRLGKGAILFADNADHAETAPLIQRLQNAETEFTTLYLFEGRVFLARKL